jgi:peroxiredoxin/predicted enzyme related to lactoylglutathione lyase
MSSTQVSPEQQATNRVPIAATVDLKLEAIPIPVSDVDRAKAFYEGLGWRLDADFMVGKDFRAVQLTPPGSPCSIHLSTTAVPGSAQGMLLVVSDIEAARNELIKRGVSFRRRPSARAGSRPEASVLRFICLIQRSRWQPLGGPAGDDAASRARTQQRRRDADRALARNRETSRDVRANRAETPLVRLVRGLRGGARAREDSRRGRQRCHAPHRKCACRTGVRLVMRSDIVAGSVFPDYELSDHRGMRRTLSELQQGDPLVLVLSRGGFCPKERRQHEGLLQLHREMQVGYCRMVTISTDNLLETNEFRAGVGAHWTFLSDPGRKVQKDLDIAEYTDPDHNPMIPHTVVLEPGRRVYKIYNGYWFFARPTIEELRLDLRAVLQRCRPDWDISSTEQRTAWANGDKVKFYPYGRTQAQVLAEQD